MKKYRSIFLILMALAFLMAGCSTDAPSGETPSEVTVTLSSISVKSLPAKTEYLVDDVFDPSGLVIKADYSDGSTKNITYSLESEIKLSSPDMTVTGEKTVQITYQTKTTSFKITVKEKSTVDLLDTGIKLDQSAVLDKGAVESVVYNEDGTVTYNAGAKYSGGGIVYYINADKSPVSLEKYESIEVEFDFSADENNWASGANKPQWCLNLYKVGENFWGGTTLAYFGDSKASGTTTYKCVPDEKYFGDYVAVCIKLNTYDTNNEETDFCSVTIKKIKFTKKINESEPGTEPDPEPVVSTNWLSSEVPGIYETYKDIFDTIGIAAEYGNFGLKMNGSDKYTASYTQQYWGTPSELYYEEIQKGIAKHANSITLGNEMKPQFLLQWWNGDGSAQSMVDFTGSNGKKIKVPSTLNGENLIYATLNTAKAMKVQMRGHVLTWHSQTPDGFFAEGYKPEYDGALITNLVDPETMTARHEWYIKTVLECVANWEKANGYGEGNHIIWAWDVVNESCADDATEGNWYRGNPESETYNKAPGKGGSRWYQVYGSNEFIVNAFRFANAYAASDIKLCYNEYNEYWDAPGHLKTTAIENLVKDVRNGASQTVNGKSVKPRIDVVAMQSHVGVSWPGVQGYENALKRFLALGVDVHVSELDFSAATQAEATKAYGEYFSMLKKYGKAYSGSNRVTNVTIWGINNESSWINPSSEGGKKTYPLLFNLVNNVTGNTKDVVYDTGSETLQQYDVGDSYETNDAFWAVINAAK